MRSKGSIAGRQRRQDTVGAGGARRKLGKSGMLNIGKAKGNLNEGTSAHNEDE